MEISFAWDPSLAQKRRARNDKRSKCGANGERIGRYAGRIPPLAGLGVGFPIGRLLAKVFASYPILKTDQATCVRRDFLSRH